MQRRLVLEPVAPQPPRDERVVERPDRADVVADRVVPPLALGERAHAPAREQPRPHRDGRATAFAFDLSTMPLHSRWPLFDASASTWLPSASSASAKYSPSSTQKSRLKRRFRSAACFSSVVGERGVLPDLAREPGAAQLGVVRVALELARRAREAGQAAVAVRDRVPRVLPALVLEPGLLVAALVRDVAVALEVGVLVDPVQRGPRLVLEVAHELACRRSSARTRRAARRTAASRRRSRSTASAAAPRTRSSRRSASRAGSGRDPRRGSRRRACPAAGRARAASWPRAPA